MSKKKNNNKRLNVCVMCGFLWGKKMMFLSLFLIFTLSFTILFFWWRTTKKKNTRALGFPYWTWGLLLQRTRTWNRSICFFLLQFAIFKCVVQCIFRSSNTSKGWMRLYYDHYYYYYKLRLVSLALNPYKIYRWLK